ncbi:MAG: hypothetical protein AAGC68_15200, partial [Verrucomicrobiota bacterium]
VLDTIVNGSGDELAFEVDLRSTFPFSWQTLHDLDGEILPQDPVLSIPPQQPGFFVHFGPAEGRHDTLLLAGPEVSSAVRHLGASNNQRELTLSYQLELGGRESASLHHWILQRNLSTVEAAIGTTAEFLRRGRLLNAQVPEDLKTSLVNYPPSALEGASASPRELRSLHSLNRLIDPIGMHRRGEDVLWLSASNQLSGTVSSEAVLKVNSSPFGERTVPIREIAAIRGGGNGFVSLFLRDGRVLVGAGNAENLWIDRGTETEPERDEIDLGRISLLLLHTEPGDGAEVDGSIGFVELRNGEVQALGKGTEASISLLTEWGMHSVPWQDISSFAILETPSPHLRVNEKDGTTYRAIFASPEIELVSDRGEKWMIDRTRIRSFWAAGNAPVFEDDPFEWLDLSEAPESGSKERFLFSGNQIMVGGFASSELEVEDGSSRIRIPTSSIESVTRLIEGGDTDRPRYEIQVRSGDMIQGGIVGQGRLEVRRGETVVSWPSSAWVGYRKEGGE